jgi:UPF0716 family protein affecting phage T7 exclusion
MRGMRRRLDVRWAIGVVVAAAVLGGAVHVVHGYQVQRNARSLLTRAEQAEAQGQKA